VTRPIPTLEEVAAEPAKAVGLPLEALTALAARHAAVGTILATQLAVSLLRPTTPAHAAPDRLLTPSEAAALLKVDEGWLRRRARRLPFSRRLSRKVTRFSLQGLQRWQAAQQQR
jgi:hypothetical protein